MTSKLLKYELKSGLRGVGLFWLALLLVAVFAGVLTRVIKHFGQTKADVIFALLDSFSSVAYGVLIAIIVVITLVLIIKRFYNGLLQEEGYLMHTLPAKKSNLIASKQIAAIIIIILSVLVILASALILGTISDPAGALSSIKDIVKGVIKEPLSILYALEFIVLVITSFLLLTSEIYTSLSIGQLADNHRILLSVVAFFILNIIMTALGVFAAVELTRLGVPSDFLSALDSLSRNLAAQIVIGIVFVVEVVSIIILNLITGSILKRKLNLQ